MSDGQEIVTVAVVQGALFSVLGFFLSRWFGRVETKIDQIPTLVTRDECTRNLGRVHQRLDEQLSDHSELSERIAKIEARQ